MYYGTDKKLSWRREDIAILCIYLRDYKSGRNRDGQYQFYNKHTYGCNRIKLAMILTQFRCLFNNKMRFTKKKKKLKTRVKQYGERQ